MVMSRMPSVYIPTEPENNGLGMPVILSLLIHISAIGFVFFTHRVPDIDVPPSIETSIVTPEELAAIQAGVRANRAAGNEGTQGDVSSESYAANEIINNSNSKPLSAASTSQTSQEAEVSRHSVPVFVPSNEPPTNPSDIDTRLDSRDIKSLDYEKRQQIFNEEMQKQAEQNLQDFANDIAKSTEKSKKSNSQASQRIEKVFPASNSKKTNTKGNNNAPVSMDLANDGDPLISGGSGATKGSQSGGGNIDGALVSHIEPYWQPPKNRVGEQIMADVTVDANGNVLSIKINSTDNELKSSLENAIRNASPLTPIQGTDKRRLGLHFVVK